MAKIFLLSCLFILTPFWPIKDVPSTLWVHDTYYRDVWTETYSREALIGWIIACTLLIFGSLALFFRLCSSASANIKKLVEMDLNKDNIARFNAVTRARKQKEEE